MTKKQQAVDLSVVWDTSGPFFEKDVEKTVRENIGDFLDKVADTMEESVRTDITGHAGSMPAYSGWSWAHTVGRRRSNGGRLWELWSVVSANTASMGAKEAIRTKAAAATIERRWHPYRRAARNARGVIRTLDLTKGLE